MSTNREKVIYSGSRLGDAFINVDGETVAVNALYAEGN